jgi:hypothetical protein
MDALYIIPFPSPFVIAKKKNKEKREKEISWSHRPLL